jgi:uncharacterized delta-60 repeat protein
MPHITPASFAINEDDAYLYSLSEFNDRYGDPEGDSLLSIRIISVPLFGSLLLGDAPLSPGCVVSLTEISAGLLRYMPPANANGTGIDSFNFAAVDLTGQEDPTHSTFSFDVTAVNDAPTFRIGDGRVSTPTDQDTDDVAESVRVLADGSIVLAGSTVPADGVSRFALVRYDPDGRLDATFGHEGRVMTAIGLVRDTASGMAMQADGKIVVAGYMVKSPMDSDFAVIRHNGDGSLDTSFSGDGKVTSSMGSRSDSASSVAVQPDGKIIISGYTVTNDDGTDSDFAVARYQSDGSLDKSFSSDGKTTTSLGTMVAEAYGMALQSDGKILVVGFATQTAMDSDFALVRYDTGGTLDKSFSGDGKLTTSVGFLQDVARSVAVQADGKIVIGGYSFLSEGNSDFALVRCNEDGSLDTGFDGDGMVTTPVGSSADRAYRLVVQGDGRILAGGYAWNGSDWDIALVRYNSDGTPDATFDGDGMVITPAGIVNPDSLDMVLQPDGRIVVASSIWNGRDNDFMLARYNPDGTSDRSFDPVDTLGGTVSYVEGSGPGVFGTPVVLDADVQIFDVELDAAGSYEGAALSLFRLDGANPDDRFSATGTMGALSEGSALTIAGTAIGMVTTNSGGLLRLDFGAAASAEKVSMAMQSIAYANDSDTPEVEVTIKWIFSDGDVLSPQSAIGTTQVTITPMEEESYDCTLDVSCWQNEAGLEGVTAVMTENTTLAETVSTEQHGGNYGFGTLEKGNYTLTAEKAGSGNEGGAVTVDDAIDAAGLAVGNGGGESPYRYLAADLDRDGMVGFRDALGILKMALGRDDAPEPERVIVPASTGDEPMSNDKVNWPDASIPVILNQDTEIDLVGVLLGDVNGSWGN